MYDAALFFCSVIFGRVKVFYCQYVHVHVYIILLIWSLIFMNINFVLHHHYIISFGLGTGRIWLDEVICNGNEDFLTQCQYDDLQQHDCTHYEDAGVVCQGECITLTTQKKDLLFSLFHFAFITHAVLPMGLFW